MEKLHRDPGISFRIDSGNIWPLKAIAVDASFAPIQGSPCTKSKDVHDPTNSAILVKFALLCGVQLSEASPRGKFVCAGFICRVKLDGKEITR